MRAFEIVTLMQPLFEPGSKTGSVDQERSLAKSKDSGGLVRAGAWQPCSNLYDKTQSAENVSLHHEITGGQDVLDENVREILDDRDGGGDALFCRRPGVNDYLAGRFQHDVEQRICLGWRRRSCQ